ncbi:MAG: hypothetical protein ACREBB_10695 [Nitrosotalea sp.]
MSIDESSLRITTASYGIAIVIISAIMHYLAQPGIESCNSMSGIVLSYTSQDYSEGCQILSNIQTGSMFTGIIGAAVIIFGILQKPKN